MDDVELGGRERRTLWLSSAAITLLVLLQARGRIIPETKLDLTLDPVGYLARSLTAWDPSAGFGRVQNQAIGYLFPMGAFSAAAHGAGVPAWIVQRLWISLVLVVGLWGAHRVARALGVASPSGRVLAALAYALAPATFSAVAFQSAGQVPYALAPWVLVPLLLARDGDHPRRVAARSALAVAAMGGVNGASAFAVLPLAVIWFLTRTPGPARRRLAAWWAAGVVAATLWWLVPLLVSIRYGIRFTQFTETSLTTTITESGMEVLRGSGNWLSFIQTKAGLWLPGGWSLSSDRVAIVGSVLVAAAGAWGLARRDLPGRSWLVPSFVLGTVAVGAGYSGAWGGGLSGLVQQLLDGPLVPFRNVHKFSAVVHLPMAIGLGHLVTVATARARAAQEDRSGASPSARAAFAVRAIPAAAVVIIAMALLPTADGHATAPGSFTAVPRAWRDAAAWIDAHQDGRRSLLFPGSAFGEYEWGRPLDEPLSSYLDSEWAVRDLIPLGGTGSTRLLDGMEQALATQSLPPGFVTSLQRSGIRYLVVRNDLDLLRTEAPRPATVRRLLQTAPELHLVASFGPVRSDPGSDQRLAPQPGIAAGEAFRTVDVYEVPGAVDRAVAYPAAGAAVTSGGPEAMLQLEPAITDGRAVVLATEPEADDLPDPLLVATDTARRRDVRFGALRNNVTYTLTADEPSPTTGEEPLDRWPAGDPIGLTTARVQGAAALTDSRRPNQTMRPEQQPFAAFDGNPGTAWGPGKARVGEWVQARFSKPTDLGTVTIRIPSTTGKRVGAVSVLTDGGIRRATIGPDGSATVTTPGPTRRIRVAIDSIVGVRPVARVGISEIEMAGVQIRRPLVVPSPAPAGAQVVSLARSHVDPFDLVHLDEDGALDRVFRWAGTPTAEVRGTATAVPGPALDHALATAAGTASPDAVTAAASSQLRDLPAFAPAMAVDGDPRTAWVSDPQATTPSLTLRWSGAVSLDGLQVHVLDAVVDPVSRVVVEAGGQRFERNLDPTGAVNVPVAAADSVTISFPRDPDDRTDARQVGVSEVTIPALLGRTATSADRDQRVSFACGDGPALVIDGRMVPTRASATVGQLLDARPVDWSACAPVALAKGSHQLTGTGGQGALLASTTVVGPSGGIPAAPRSRATKVTSWHAASRTVRIGAGGAAILATTENRNDGWTATLDGKELTPIRVDGWRQGWRVPAGAAGTVELRYHPATTQRIGLAIGVAALLALAAAAWLRPHRPRGTTWRAPGDRNWAPWAVVGLLGITGVALGGPLVLVAVPLVLLARREPRGRWIAAVAGGAVLAGGLIVVIWAGAGMSAHRGTYSGPAQACAVTAILAVGAALLRPSPGLVEGVGLADEVEIVGNVRLDDASVDPPAGDPSV